MSQKNFVKRFIVRILTCKFHHADSILRILFYGLYYADYIIWTPLCGLYCANSIVQTPVCRFYYAMVRSNVQVPLWEFHYAYSIMWILLYDLLCGFCCADFIVRMVSCRWYYANFIVRSIVCFVMQVLSCGFHCTASILYSAEFIVPILLYAWSYSFHCASFIMQILLFKFYCAFMPFIVQILLCAPLSKFYCTIVNSIARIRLCGFDWADSIMYMSCKLSCKLLWVYCVLLCSNMRVSLCIL